MEFSDFQDFIQATREIFKKEKELESLGVSLNGWIGYFNNVVIPLRKAVFNKEQRNAIDWWLYDAPNGIESNPTKHHMWDKDNNVIDVTDERKLFDYLKTLA